MAIGIGDSDLDPVRTGSTLIALGMISAGALGLLGVLPPSPPLIAILLLVVVVLSFGLGKRWTTMRIREGAEAGADHERA